MKIQYVLVSVSRETKYFCNDKRVELVREEAFFVEILNRKLNLG